MYAKNHREFYLIKIEICKNKMDFSTKEQRRKSERILWRKLICEKWIMKMQMDTQRGLQQVGQIGTTLWVGLVWNYCGHMQKHAGSLVFW